MERELGFPLLDRKNRKFELTSAGDFFYKKSLVLVADYEQIIRETSALAGGEPECLKIGFLRCYSGQEFHLALEEFAGKYPDIPVEVFYGNHDELYHMLVNNEVDLAFNDQRRAFSDEFVNMVLVSSVTHIEILCKKPDCLFGQGYGTGIEKYTLHSCVIGGGENKGRRILPYDCWFTGGETVCR